MPQIAQILVSIFKISKVVGGGGGGRGGMPRDPPRNFLLFFFMSSSRLWLHRPFRIERDCLNGQVVKVSASNAGDSGIASHLSLTSY